MVERDRTLPWVGGLPLCVGFALSSGTRSTPYWLGHRGGLSIQGERVAFHFPFTTGLIVSIDISLFFLLPRR